MSGESVRRRPAKEAEGVNPSQIVEKRECVSQGQEIFEKLRNLGKLSLYTILSCYSCKVPM
jgi:hypothetical protein